MEKRGKLSNFVLVSWKGEVPKHNLFKVTVDLQGPILSKIIFLLQIQDFYFIWIFQKKSWKT